VYCQPSTLFVSQSQRPQLGLPSAPAPHSAGPAQELLHLPEPQTAIAFACSQLKQLGPGPQLRTSVSEAHVVVPPLAHWCEPTAQPQVEPEQAKPLLQLVPQQGCPKPPQGLQLPPEQLVPAAVQALFAQHG
jgi:hypothetical protein